MAANKNYYFTVDGSGKFLVFIVSDLDSIRILLSFSDTTGAWEVAGIC